MPSKSLGLSSIKPACLARLEPPNSPSSLYEGDGSWSLKDAQEFPWPWLLFHLPTVQTIRRTSGLIGVHYAYWTQEHTQKYQQNLNRFCSSGNY
jgi:hypothetical protein